jgi:hypothetical protein
LHRNFSAEFSAFFFRVDFFLHGIFSTEFGESLKKIQCIFFRVDFFCKENFSAEFGESLKNFGAFFFPR